MIRTVLLVATLIAAGEVSAQTAPAAKPAAPAPAPTAKMATEATRIDINTATVEQLAAVKGLSKVFAEAIVKARPFRSVEDLTTGKILPAEVFALVKEQLIVR
jgi:DNA uptake protein ComE-like DNA-binding protein